MSESDRENVKEKTNFLQTMDKSFLLTYFKTECDWSASTVDLYSFALEHSTEIQVSDQQLVVDPKIFGEFKQKAEASKAQAKTLNTLKVQWQKEIQDSLRPDGRIGVLNQCRQKDGTLLTASGTARVVHQSTKAKLKVSFFWPFSGDYWILELGPNYEYAMVGEPRRKYLWILSRQRNLDEETYLNLVTKARLVGFDTSRLIRTTGKQ